MRTIGYALFDTAIGRCAIAWSERGIAALQLPGSSDAATVARMERRHGLLSQLPPPPHVEEAIHAVASLLAGEGTDLRQIPIDLDAVPAFDRGVYEAAREIPPGTTRTYGALAAALGEPGAARAVGQALGANPVPVIVPCHRVVGAGGDLGGFSAPGGAATKRRLLLIEGYQAAAPQLALFD